MAFVVGGQQYDFDRKLVETVMKKVEPEAIQKHFVELLGKSYPPKQVFAELTARRRATFTTQEAVRVLSRLGFACREVGHRDSGAFAAPPTKPSKVSPERTPDPEDRLTALESGLATVHLAIAQLQKRVETLDAR
ncbi:MAG: hypothetical protein NTX12_08910 [Actinobacteria bacterium]|nr:hypothetical protein [Actinomycetota bacterium]